MAIIKRPPKIGEDEKIVAGAQDGREPARVRRGNRAHIGLTLDESMLDQIDLIADRLGVKRSAMICLALTRVFEKGDL